MDEEIANMQSVLEEEFSEMTSILCDLPSSQRLVSNLEEGLYGFDNPYFPISSVGKGKKNVVERSGMKAVKGSLECIIIVDRFSKVTSEVDFDTTRELGRIGFYGLLNLRGCTFIKELTRNLVHSFDTNTQTLLVGDRKYILTCGDFSKIMGVPEGPEKVHLDGNLNDISRIRDTFGSESQGRTVLRVANLEEHFRKGNLEVDDRVRCFILLAIGILLGPSTKMEVKKGYLFSLDRMEKIRDLNWASHLFQLMVEGIKKFKSHDIHKRCCITGCVLFLQLYYLIVVMLNSKIENIQFSQIGIVDPGAQHDIQLKVCENKWCRSNLGKWNIDSINKCSSEGLGQRNEYSDDDSVEGVNVSTSIGQLCRVFKNCVENTNEEMKYLRQAQEAMCRSIIDSQKANNIWCSQMQWTVAELRVTVENFSCCVDAMTSASDRRKRKLINEDRVRAKKHYRKFAKSRRNSLS